MSKPNMLHPEVAAEFANTKAQLDKLRSVVKTHCAADEYLTPGGDYNSRTEYGALMLYTSQLWAILNERGY